MTAKKTREPVSRRTLPNLPWDLRRDPPLRQVFVMGIANKRIERVNGEPWPVVYKIVRWYRLSLLRFSTQAKQNARVKAFIAARSADVIKEGLRSVHTLCVVDVRSEGSVETVTTTPYDDARNHPPHIPTQETPEEPLRTPRPRHSCP